MVRVKMLLTDKKKFLEDMLMNEMHRPRAQSQSPYKLGR